MAGENIELGCGLIRIGRKWGVRETPIPNARQVRLFLNTALKLGIRYFDTAPAYGLSEARLGQWLTDQPLEVRNELTIATKFGELWKNGQSQIDHSFKGLRTSLNQSIGKMGRIDVLQLHQTTPDVLRSKDLKQAWRYARDLGVTTVGASVKDLESARIVCEDPDYNSIQIPFNMQDMRFVDVIQEANARGMQVILNRPFASGETIEKSDGRSPAEKAREAYQFILEQDFWGVVLTGTQSPDHLRENWEAFMAAQAAAA